MSRVAIRAGQLPVDAALGDRSTQAVASLERPPSKTPPAGRRAGRQPSSTRGCTATSIVMRGRSSMAGQRIQWPVTGRGDAPPPREEYASPESASRFRRARRPDRASPTTHHLRSDRWPKSPSPKASSPGRPTSPSLIGSACEGLRPGGVPGPEALPRAAAARSTERLLEPRGSLYTWTTQSFPPVAPPYVGDTGKDTFEPYGMGWVQLSDTLMIESRLTESDPDKLEFGMPVELVLIPLTGRRRGQRGPVVRLPAGDPLIERGADMYDVAIIGVGLHPFGRFPGKSAVEMGADAIRLALGDAGARLARHPVRLRRQLRGRQPRQRGHLPRTDRHPLHQRVQRVRHRRLVARHGRQDDLARRLRHRPGRRDGQAPGAGLLGRLGRVRPAGLVRRDRALPHHQVLRHEDQPVHARSRHQRADAGQGGSQELPQRLAQPQRLPPPAPDRGADPRVARPQPPAAPVHVLRARRGRGRGRPVPRRPGPPLHLDARSTCGPPPCAPASSAPSRCTAPGPRCPWSTGPPCRRRGRPSRWRASVPTTST